MNSVIKKEQFLINDYDAIEFTDHIHPRIRVKPMYYHLGFSHSHRIFGRRIVLDSLFKALQFLPDNAGFLVWDVYRPRAVQDIEICDS